MTLPLSFQAELYKKCNPDLSHLDNDQATMHYLITGYKENRSFEETLRKSIIYFSPQWPCYNRNSGGKRLLEILQILCEENDVYYFVNEGPNKEYEDKLRQLGIKYFCHGIDVKSQLIKLKQENINFSTAFFSWWQTSYYVGIVRSIFPDVKIVGDSVDVHWLREERGGISSFERKESEKLFYKSCDIVLAVTHNDRLEIEKECKINNVRVVSNVHEEQCTSFQGGRDIVFLGGFVHQPNITAAIRTHEIYQRFKKESGKDCCLHIVGDRPPEEIQKLHNNKNVFVTGHVEDIKVYFKKARVLMAPLTWGAGIKGKICEAIMNKVPVLTSRIGVEGLDLNNFEDCFVAENDREFLGGLKQIYSLNEELINDITSRAFKKTINLVSKESARTIIKSIVEPNPHVVVSIVTYKNQEILKSCLKSIEENTDYKNFCIVVTDNANEKEVEAVVQRYKIKGIKIEYVGNERNEYFSRPHNKVIERFKKSDIIILNDDTIIKTKCWIRAIQDGAYIAGEVACCGGKPIMSNGLLEEAGSMIFNNGHGRNFGRDEDPNKEEHNTRKFVGYCSGCLLYLRRDALKKVGTLDENFKPLYFEDTDWQYRAHIIGLKVLYEPKCTYIHLGRSTTRNKLNEYVENCRAIFLEKYKDHDLEQYGHKIKWGF